MQITKQMRTETGHRLTNYNGRCAHLHGHSYLWEITVEGELDNRCMVADFKDLKTIMNQVLDHLDHCMVLAPDDPLLEKAERLLCSTDAIDAVAKLFWSTNNESPRLEIWHENPTAESFAEYAAKNIGMNLPEGQSVSRVRVWETATSFAEWNCKLPCGIKK